MCTQFCLRLLLSVHFFRLEFFFHASMNSALYLTHESSQNVSCRGLHKYIIQGQRTVL